MTFNTEEQAKREAHILRMFWLCRGYDVEFSVVSEQSGQNGYAVWGVRSNLVNGMPPKQRMPSQLVRKQLSRTLARGNA